MSRGLPAPLVWISPGSLARSPMVSLRHLEADDGGGPSAPERALTMTFRAGPGTGSQETVWSVCRLWGPRLDQVINAPCA